MTPRVALSDEDRNPTYLDWWSLTHIAWGALLAVLMPPFWALVVMTLWEPFEILVLSPLLGRLGHRFGHETLRNSLMDLVFDVVGVLVGALLVRPLIAIAGGGA